MQTSKGGILLLPHDQGKKTVEVQEIIIACAHKEEIRLTGQPGDVELKRLSRSPDTKS